MNPEDQSDRHKMSDLNDQDAEMDNLSKDHSKTPEFFQLIARLTTLSWNLVIPIVGGTILGHYIDVKLGGGHAWTLSLLVLGVIVAFSNLYNLYVEQGGNKKPGEEQDDNIGMDNEEHQ
jgi:ATP synthase protein I